MTNEEKTNKICCKNCTLKSFCKKKGRCDMYKSVLKMAVWKDQQMIEKAVEWLEPIFKNLAGYDCGGDLINDFKNYMQDE